MKIKQSILAIVACGAASLVSTQAIAAEYTIDATHSFVQFKTQHLGMSWLYGRFNKLEGSFNFDDGNPEASSIEVNIDATAVDSNHAERDKHLRSEDFLNVSAFPTATFKSTGYSGSADSGTLAGDLTVHGVTKSIEIPITRMGEGKDPWGGYRAGFSGSYSFTRADFGMDYNLGPKAAVVEIELGIEGIRK